MNAEPRPGVAKGGKLSLTGWVSGSNPARGVKWICTRPSRSSPSHGENRGSSPLGSANKINGLISRFLRVSRLCPVKSCRIRPPPLAPAQNTLPPAKSECSAVW